MAGAQATPPAPTAREILVAEHARAEDVSPLMTAIRGSDPRLQRMAVRALGRFERPTLRDSVVLALTAADPRVRAEAVNALGQMNASFPYRELLLRERDGFVRGVIYETIGRVRTTPDSAEQTLAQGLSDAAVEARAGAARGLESLIRRTARTARPSQATIMALRRAARDSVRGPIATELRENALLAMSAAGDRDSLTAEAALRDSSEQVRRVAVALLRRWVDDPSYIVRLQGLRYVDACDRLAWATNDESEHVVLAAIVTLGARECDNSLLTRLADSGRSWRVRGRAVQSLALRAPELARPRVRQIAESPIWQLRAYAATAARVLRDSATVGRLARDSAPNVAIAAMTTHEDALRALRNSNHAGLVIAAVDLLAGDPVRNEAVPAPILRAMLDALNRLTRLGVVTVRDPRIKLLGAIAKGTDTAAVLAAVRPLLADRDPDVAMEAAKIVASMSKSAIQPVTTRYRPPPSSLPSDAFLRALQGATAVMRIRGVGDVELSLLTEDATIAVATFAALADSGKFNGLTFHRIVPNFVVQGASPGANEYDALTSWFMRDELGLVRNGRGTFGVSTRGRDTGDGQLYINLIDNFRLDHDYTVFARTLRGLDVIDRIQEGDVIESVRIIRPSRNR